MGDGLSDDLNAFVDVALNLLAEKSQDNPTFRRQMFVDFAVAGNVAFNFRNPKILPAFEIMLAIFPVEAVPKFRVAEHGNFQPQKNNVILGRETKILFGKKNISDKICDLKFSISARSFFQVNTAQAEILYQTAKNFAELTGNEIVIDAYCGTGTISQKKFSALNLKNLRLKTLKKMHSKIKFQMQNLLSATL